MKPKPRPKEISIRPIDTPVGVGLIITYETPDAFEFVKSLAEFGTLQDSPLRNTNMLVVSGTFDWKEILEYIESYN